MGKHSNQLFNTKNRIEFFLASFAPLWAIMIISYLIKDFSTPIIICAIIIAVIVLLAISSTIKKFRQIRTSTNAEEIEISEARETTQDYIPYVISYLFPVLVDLTNVHILFSVISVLILIGILYIRTDMLLTNPSLLLVGFRVYEVKTQNSDKIKIISKSPIGRNDLINVKNISQRIYIQQKDST